MSKTISGRDLRDRLLARDQITAPDQVAPSEADWLHVLSSSGHRRLLSIIVDHQPQSISELSRIAGRAQSNVSRSLSALIRAGLVTTTSNGRVSIPNVTEDGRRRAMELGLMETAIEPPAVGPVDDNAVVEGSPPYLFASLKEANDGAFGDLCLNAPIHGQVVIGTSNDDLRASAHRLFDNWWRILYRRDAPYKIGTFSLAGGNDATLLLRSRGSLLDRVLRLSGPRPHATHDTVDCSKFEQELISSVLRPVVAACSKNNAAFEELFASKLSRLEDSYSQPTEREFCRTAGALNSTPYDLPNHAANLIRALIVSMPEEDSRLDFASVMSFDQIETVCMRIEDGITQLEGRNALSALPKIVEELRGEISGLARSGMKPWQKGTSAAKSLRGHLKLSADVAVGGTDKLARLFGAEDFLRHELGSNELLAFQAQVHDAPTVLVENEGGDRGGAFVLARAVGDYLVFQSRKSCVANKYTDRQAVGRAFAAEFMAPAEGVLAMIEDEQSTTQVASHYGVPLEVVERQYSNNYAMSDRG